MSAILTGGGGSPEIIPKQHSDDLQDEESLASSPKDKD